MTDINGVYSLPGLPPGSYTVKFEMSGMSTVERTAAVPLGGAVTMDQVLSIAPVSEVVVVHGARPAPVSSPAGAFNVRAEQFSLMPTARTPFCLAELAPGLTDNTPNRTRSRSAAASPTTTSSSMDGVDINDNVFGQPNGLFIEEGIQEVQVLTSGIRAEYGRFGGGVVNVITRSGGNVFSGAFRTNLTNPAWSAETPLEKSRGHDARQQAVADLRGDRRRTGRAGPRCGSSAARASSARPRGHCSPQTRVAYTGKNDNTPL